MIQKKYRLKEKEVKKALQRGKPFFSYGIVKNSLKNKLGYNRFAIVISGKSVKNAVERNYFRRLFYSLVSEYLQKGSFDIVFVVKVKTKLSVYEKKVLDNFKKDILFLLKKS